MAASGIYRVTISRASSEEGPLFYIGKSVNVTKRGREHLKHLRQRRHANKYWKDPDYRAKTTEILRSLVTDPLIQARRKESYRITSLTEEHRALRSKLGRELGLREETKKKRREANQRPDILAKRVASAKAVYERPEIQEMVKERWASEEFRALHKSRLTAATNTPEMRAKRSETSKVSQNRPEVLEKHRQNHLRIQNDPKVRAKKIAGMKAAMATPEWKERRRLSDQKPEVKERRRRAAIACWEKRRGSAQ